MKYNCTEKRNLMFLKQKSFLLSLFIASFLVIIVNSGYCANNDLTSLNDVNSIDIVAYKKPTQPSMSRLFIGIIELTSLFIGKDLALG